MSSFALTDATVLVGGYDFTTDLNKLNVSATADELDSTTFGSGGYRTRIGGLKHVTAQLDGFWQSATANAPDPQTFANLGTVDTAVTVSPTGTALDVAYMFRAGT